ncbi:hypothetical protein WN48_02888 [Eufriesea mexicana]|uniref:Uncharacterized protein n=1 Tax=Eufriesea mexicana TaxID=516756 RepID=A0A310SB67_9HYME|nr:hypothetical protein WN48_02888 [Eufriesea mexicana]
MSAERRSKEEKEKENIKENTKDRSMSLLLTIAETSPTIFPVVKIKLYASLNKIPRRVTVIGDEPLDSENTSLPITV